MSKLRHFYGSKKNDDEEELSDEEQDCLFSKFIDENDRILIATEKIDGYPFYIGRKGNRLFVNETRNNLFASKSNKNISVKSQSSVQSIIAEFSKIRKNRDRLFKSLEDGQVAQCEWIGEARGTRYQIKHDFPIVVTRLWEPNGDRVPFRTMWENCLKNDVPTPFAQVYDYPVSLDNLKRAIREYGGHGALDPIEGLVIYLEDSEGHLLAEGQFIYEWYDETKWMPITPGEPGWENFDIDKTRRTRGSVHRIAKWSK